MKRYFQILGPTTLTLLYSVAQVASAQIVLKNPLAVNSLCNLLKVVLDGVLIVGLPVAVVFLIIVGFQFILARGNSDKLREAKRNFMYTVLGIALFLGAWTLAEIIRSTVQSLGANTGSC